MILFPGKCLENGGKTLPPRFCWPEQLALAEKFHRAVWGWDSPNQISYLKVIPIIEIYLRSTPHPVTVTTRIITFLVGNPYKPSFATVTGWGVDPRYMGVNPKIGVYIPKMDGLFQGKPVIKMDDLGVFPLFVGNTHIYMNIN